MFIYAKFRLDVACQKLLKSANVSQSYSKNNSWLHFTWPTLYIITYNQRQQSTDSSFLKPNNFGGILIESLHQHAKCTPCSWGKGKLSFSIVRAKLPQTP